jgi:aquaporin Z
MARATTALSDHWPEYLIEGAGLGLFMISACLFGTLLGHPDSPIVRALPDPFVRRVLMGCAMGLTAVVLIYSSWGQRSGAHFNPATTLTFWRLGKVATRDAAFYVGAQTIGGLVGVLAAAVVLRERLAHPSVRYVVTEPGPAGRAEAFVAEALITFILMTVVLHVSNTARLARFTGLCAGILLAVYIAIEAPISGMSMNPARSLASAIPARTWTALWVYFTAPPLGMLMAAQAYVALCGRANVFCAKLHHGRTQRCIFRCRHAEMLASQSSAEPNSQPALSAGC